MRLNPLVTKEEQDLHTAMRAFSDDFNISLTVGPANAYFRTPSPGGCGTDTYAYRVLTEGGPVQEGEDSGNGCDTYEQAKAMFLALLKQHTTAHLPIIVRTGPEVSQDINKRWRIYFRYVQLAFAAKSILVELPLG